MFNKRKLALELLNSYIKNPKMLSHSLATEAVMRHLSAFLREDEESWGLCGLLHDIDVEITDANPNIHGTKARELLQPLELSEEVIEAIERHNEISSKLPRNKPIHHALSASETITGLVFATALVYPDKKISSVKPKSVVKRMKEKHFAASVKRENILECEIINVPLLHFASLAVEAMTDIEKELGF